MKAILEFKAPESCLGCPLNLSNKTIMDNGCYWTNKPLPWPECKTERATFCPLRIVEEPARREEPYSKEICPKYTKGVNCPHYGEYSCPAYDDCPGPENGGVGGD